VSTAVPSAQLQASHHLLDFVEDFRPESLLDAVRRECIRAFTNAMGCAIGGGGHSLVNAAWRALGPFGGAPTASLIGRGAQSDALSAAMLNALAGAAYSFDDAYSEALLHPSGPAMSALLALSQIQAMSGAQFIGYFALAMEISCRLADVIASSKDRSWIAWSQTGICCGAGVALAAGKALGLRRQQLEWAIGIALSQASGTRATHGSMSASLIFGQASSSGLRAALMARDGFTASSGAIEGRFGFAAVFARDADLSPLTDGIGERWALMANTYKPFPCALMIHAALDAILQIKAQSPYPHEDVDRIELHVPPAAITLCSRPNPENEMEAKLSIEHWIAAAAVFGKAGIAEGALDVVRHPAVARLRARIVLTGDEALANDAARVAVSLSDGRVLHRSVEHCVGGLKRPMSDRQIEEKFLDLAQLTIGSERAKDVLKLCLQAASLTDISIAAIAAC
jgi:2-methylcitrate dehydratase PrpD